MPKEKVIETPKALLELFDEYQEWVKANPYLVHDFKGKDADEVRIEKQRPITWSGFEAWLAKEGVLTQLTHYEQNDRNSYAEYLPIVARIKAICRGDVLDGALSGVYNQNIAARIEGLADKKEVDKTVRKVKFTDAG